MLRETSVVRKFPERPLYFCLFLHERKGREISSIKHKPTVYPLGKAVSYLRNVF